MNEPQGPGPILALSRGFMESRIFLTGAELDIFSKLHSPLSAWELAGQNGWQERPLIIVLDALAAMDFLVKEEGKYQTKPELLPWLDPKSPDSVMPMVMHAARLWKNWSDLTGIVEKTGGPEKPSSSLRSPEDLRAFIGAMHVVGRGMADRIVSLLRPEAAGRLLDVGGASGTYTMSFLKANPELKATLFDRPDVVAMARERLDREGLLARVHLVAGDFYTDELPAGHDLALLSAIIHQNSDEQNLKLFEKIFAALNPGGRIVIRDHVMSTDRTTPKSGALFAVNMLTATPGGGTYTFNEIEANLVQAGFVDVRLLQTGRQMDGLVEAVKP